MWASTEHWRSILNNTSSASNFENGYALSSHRWKWMLNRSRRNGQKQACPRLSYSVLKAWIRCTLSLRHSTVQRASEQQPARCPVKATTEKSSTMTIRPLLQSTAARLEMWTERQAMQILRGFLQICSRVSHWSPGERGSGSSGSHAGCSEATRACA